MNFESEDGNSMYSMIATIWKHINTYWKHITQKMRYHSYLNNFEVIRDHTVFEIFLTMLADCF